MSKEDWYRNETWDINIENSFFEKLKKSRTQKSQYLKIQAFYLLNIEPDVSLRLISYARENCPDEFWEQEFYLFESKILYKKKLLDDALEKAYKSLEWRIKKPGTQTEIIYWLCELVLRMKKKSDYVKCLESMINLHRETPFPIIEYKYHAFASLILLEMQELEKAKIEAKLAIEWASKDKNLLQNERKRKYGVFQQKPDWPYDELEKIIKKDG